MDFLLQQKHADHRKSLRKGSKTALIKIISDKNEKLQESEYLHPGGHDGLLVEDGVGAGHVDVVVLDHTAGAHPEPGLEAARSTLLLHLNVG